MAPPHLAPSAAVFLASAAAVAFLATAAFSHLVADATPVVVVFDAMGHPYNHTTYNSSYFPNAPRDAINGDATGAGFVAPSPTESSRRVAWAVHPTPGYFENLFAPSLPPRSPKERERGNGPRAPRRATGPVASSPTSSPPSSPPSTAVPTGPPPPPAPSPPPAPTQAPPPPPAPSPPPAPTQGPSPPAPELAAEPAPAPPAPPAPAPEPEPGGGGDPDGGDDPDGDDDDMDGIFDRLLALDRMKLSKGLLKVSEKLCNYWSKGKKAEKTKIKKLRAKLKKMEKIKRKRQPTTTYNYNQYCGAPPASKENE